MQFQISGSLDSKVKLFDDPAIESMTEKINICQIGKFVSIGDKTYKVHSERDQGSFTAKILVDQGGQQIEQLIFFKNKEENSFSLDNHVSIITHYNKTLDLDTIKESIDTLIAAIRNFKIEEPITINIASRFKSYFIKNNCANLPWMLKRIWLKIKNFILGETSPLKNKVSFFNSEVLNNASKLASEATEIANQFLNETLKESVEEAKKVLLRKCTSDSERKEVSEKLSIKTLSYFRNRNETSLDIGINNLLNRYQVVKEDIKKEAMVLGKSEERARILMAKRLINYEKAGIDSKMAMKGSVAYRAEATEYPASLIRACEKAFDHMLKGKTSEYTQQRKVDGYVINPYKTAEGKIRIDMHEATLDSGSFKVVTLSSNFFQISDPLDRGTEVDLRPKEAAQMEPDFSPNDLPKNKYDPPIYYSHPHIIEKKGSGLDLAVERSSQDIYAEMMEKAAAKQVAAAEGTVVQGTVQARTIVQGTVRVGMQSTGAAKQEKVEDKVALTPEELLELEWEEKEEALKDYLHDISVAQKFCNRPGFMNIRHVTCIASGETVMVQEAAGFRLPGILDTDGRILRKSEKFINLSELIKFLSDSDVKCEEDFVFIVNLLKQTADSINVMHTEGYVHRDIKDQNILIKPDGTAALSDFGTALTKDELKKDYAYQGTPSYMPPEYDQFANKVTDVWAFGILLQLFIAAFNGEDEIPTHAAAGIPGGPQELIFLKLRSLKLREEEYNNNFSMPDKEQDPLNYLAWWCCRINPKERPKMQQVSEFFKSIK